MRSGKAPSDWAPLTVHILKNSVCVRAHGDDPKTTAAAKTKVKFNTPIRSTRVTCTPRYAFEEAVHTFFFAIYDLARITLRNVL